MISTTEIGWEDSGAARVPGILALGNETWTDENVPGYPVNRVKPGAGRFITVYGTTAAGFEPPAAVTKHRSSHPMIRDPTRRDLTAHPRRRRGAVDGRL